MQWTWAKFLMTPPEAKIGGETMKFPDSRCHFCSHPVKSGETRVCFMSYLSHSSTYEIETALAIYQSSALVFHEVTIFVMKIYRDTHKGDISILGSVL